MDGKNLLSGCTKAALSACRANLGSLIGQTALQGIPRLAALFCLGLALTAEQGKYLFLTAFMLIAALAILPFRFLYGEKLRAYLRRDDRAEKSGVPYVKWLQGGCMRLLRGLLWGLPFLAGFGYFVWLMENENMSFTEVGQFFARIAAFFSFFSADGGLTARGMMLYFSALLLFALLFALGWRRDMALEYLDVRSSGIRGILRQNREIITRARGAIARGMVENLLLSLPALVLLALVIYPYLHANIRISENPLMTVRNLKKLLMQPPPLRTMLLLAADFLFVYLPLCVVRKMRNAVLIDRLTRGDSHAA